MRTKSDIVLNPRRLYGRESADSLPHGSSAAQNDSLEMCAICIEDYEEGDEISWSHNEHCSHAFHRVCIIEWLLKHDECPFCRHNFLALEDIAEPQKEMTVEVGDQNVESVDQIEEQEERSATNPFRFVVFSTFDENSSDEVDTGTFRRGLAHFLNITRSSRNTSDGVSGEEAEREQGGMAELESHDIEVDDNRSTSRREDVMNEIEVRRAHWSGSPVIVGIERTTQTIWPMNLP